MRVNISLPNHVYRAGLQVAESNHRHFSGQLAAMIEAEYARLFNQPKQAA